MAVDIDVVLANSGGWLGVFADRDAAADEARTEFVARFGTTSAHPEEWDAYRHIYVSGKLVQMGYPSEFVYVLGNAREAPQAWTSPDDANMDRYNNQLGRDLGGTTPSQSALAAATEDLVRDDIAITDANGDPRIYNEAPPELSDDDYDELTLAGEDLYLDPDEPWPDTIAPMAPGAWVPGVTGPFGDGETTGSPLVLDLGTGGIDLAALNGAGSVYWDIDQDDFREASGWIAGNTALLAVDKNSDGVINDNGELFGNTSTYANGFDNLAQYDSNSNGHITSADTDFADLIVWTDDNHDGYSQSGELHSLSSLGITDINLSYSSSSSTINGNDVKQIGSFTMGGVSHTIADVWFAYDNVNSEYSGDYTLDIRTLFLPDMRGYGELPDLHIAMSMDYTGSGNLLGLVLDLATQSASELLAPAYDLETKLQEIMYRWAGVDGVDPDSRGLYADAQQLEFLEKFMGEDYLQQGIYSDPIGSLATDYLNAAWSNALRTIGGHLLAQAGLGDVLDNPQYDPLADSFEMNSVETIITLNFNTPGVAETLTGSSASDVYIFHAGDSPASGGPESVFEAANDGTDTLLFAGIDPSDVRSWTDEYNNLFIKYSATDTIRIYGNGGTTPNTIADYVERIAFDNGTVWDLTQGLILTDTDSDRTFYGSALADTIDGRGGSDTIYAYGGNDVIRGGTAADFLNGGTGDDTYIFSAGDSPAPSGPETIYENASEGTDTISFIGINPSDVRTWTDEYNNLYIKYSSTDTIRIYGGSGSTPNTISDYVERIVFDDSTGWDLTQGLVLTDTDSDRTFYGSALADTIDGRGGSDTIYAYGGNDVIRGGTAADFLNGGTGNDTYIFSAGDSPAPSGPETIYENASEGTDTISFIGINPSDVRSWTDEYNNLYIRYTATDTIRIYGGSGSTPNTISDYVERIVFDGGTVWDLTQGLILTDSDSDHVIYGSDDADIIDGRGGSDSVYGYDGNDTIQGGAGSDYLYGDGGTDTLSYDLAGSAITVSLALTSSQNTGGAGTDVISGFENLTGSAYNDTLTGDGNANVIVGGAGNDTIDGAGGTDTVLYASASAGVTVNLATATAQNTVGAGSDTLSNFENLTGSAFGDTLTGNTVDNIIDGGYGDDVIEGAAGNDTLTGGAGTDTLSYKNAGSAVTANLATATAQNTVGAGTDTIAGFENLLGSAFNDTLTGDGNTNFIEGGAGNDTMSGAGGTDTLSYASATAGITMNIATATAQATGGAGSDTVSNFENILGSGFADTLTGNGSDNVIEGGAGNDTLNGAGGTDTLSYERATSGITINLATATAQVTGGAGSDTISNFENILGSAFNDTLTGNTAVNIIDGGAGNDTIQGGTGNDTLIGGLGTDKLTYAAAASAITVSLALGSAQATGGAGTDTISGFEDLTGSASADTLTGDANANVIDGGAGNDTIDGGAGNDTLTGGSNTDTVTFASAASGVTVNLTTVTAQNTVGAGTDTISGFENLTGSAYADVLTGDTAANTINGGDGDDTIQGGAGNDTLTGGNGTDTLSYAAAASAVTVNLATATAQNTVGAGSDTISGFENLTGSAFNDTLTGNSSANTIHGGTGTNSLTGGGGADIFAFDPGVAMNNIQDFSTAQSDKLDISSLIEAYDPLTHVITDWVQITTSGANSTLFVDQDGTGSTYGLVQVASILGVTGLTDEAALVAAGTLLV